MAKRAFILGYPRSGTSLLRLLLNEHSKIIAPPECGYMQWLFPHFSNWVPEDSIDKFISAVISSRKFETWDVSEDNLRDHLIRSNSQNYGDLCEHVHRSWRSNSSPNCEVIIDKNNYYINHLDEIAEIWPDAFYIHLIRDCRGVIASHKDLKDLKLPAKYAPKFSENYIVLANDWTQKVEQIEKWLEQRYADRSITIKYENLIQKPDKVLDSVLSMWSLGYETKMLDYFKSNAKYNNEPKATIGWKHKTKEPVDLQNAKNYLNRLSAKELQEIWKEAEILLERFGYKHL